MLADHNIIIKNPFGMNQVGKVVVAMVPVALGVAVGMILYDQAKKITG